MNASEIFERLTSEARQAGLLKFCKEGVAVLILPLDGGEKEECSEGGQSVVFPDRGEGGQVGERPIEGPDKHSGTQGSFGALEEK